MSLAAADAPALDLAIAGATVEVSDRNGDLLQILPIDGETPDEKNRDYFALAEDMNFDGFPDVRILFSQGIVNTYYDCWLWNPESGRFVKCDEMRELSNPVFDQTAKTIHVYERGSVVCYVEGELAWEKGELAWIAKTVQDEAENGDGVVIRRYFRDRAGELQLVGEETRSSENLGETRVGSVCLPLELSGFNLILDLDAEPLDSVFLPNGEWWLRQGLPDRTLLLETRRLPASNRGEDLACRLIRTEWPLAREIEVAPFPVLEEKIGCLVFKAEFLDGENEDSRQFVAALILADEWSFWHVLEAAADAELSSGDSGDAAARNADLKKEMAALLLQVEPANPFDGGFLPGFGPGLYLADVDSPLRISVMDALVRIKKIVSPEASQWIVADESAYRYLGLGKVADKPALLFSFGDDSGGEFVASRYFGVDETGTVYETDSSSSGDYWQWEERGVSWWGAYRCGAALLRIDNYREGPAGMYFSFAFSIGDDEVFEGTAPVRGRSACYGQLVFSLADDDNAVSVAIAPDAGCNRDDLPLLEGVYQAE